MTTQITKMCVVASTVAMSLGLIANAAAQEQPVSDTASTPITAASGNNATRNTTSANSDMEKGTPNSDETDSITGVQPADQEHHELSVDEAQQAVDEAKGNHDTAVKYVESTQSNKEITSKQVADAEAQVRAAKDSIATSQKAIETSSEEHIAQAKAEVEAKIRL